MDKSLKTKPKPCVFNVNDMCSDFDEDCDGVKDKVWCYESDKTTGKCPYVCGHPDFQGAAV